MPPITAVLSFVHPSQMLGPEKATRPLDTDVSRRQFAKHQPLTWRSQPDQEYFDPRVAEGLLINRLNRN
jgi:hypothetical protein